MSLFLSALALAVAAPQTAPTPVAASTAIDPARKARGVELARLANSEEMTRTQTDKMLGETFPNAFAADPEFKALEKSYPGITKAMIDAMRPIVLEETMATLPELWDRLGAVYAEELTAAELDETIAFFRTPTGGRLIESIARETDFSQMAQGLIADEQAVITEKSLRADLTKGALNATRKLSPADLKIIANFGWTSAGAKLRGAQARVMPIVTAWSNATTPESDARMEKAMTDVVEKFIGKEPSDD